MVKKAKREQLFYAMECACGHLSFVKRKYEPLIRAERDARERAIKRMGLRHTYVV